MDNIKSQILNAISDSSMKIEVRGGVVTKIELTGTGVTTAYMLGELMETMINQNSILADSVAAACEYVLQEVIGNK